MSDYTTKFLPGYPSIVQETDNLNLYPNKTFNEVIYRKKEFFDKRLKEGRIFPDPCRSVDESSRTSSEVHVKSYAV